MRISELKEISDLAETVNSREPWRTAPITVVSVGTRHATHDFPCPVISANSIIYEPPIYDYLISQTLTSDKLAPVPAITCTCNLLHLQCLAPIIYNNVCDNFLYTIPCKPLDKTSPWIYNCIIRLNLNN